MNSGTKTEEISREEEFAFLFAQLVMQQSNMAMMLLGKMAHPESGKVFQDVEAARLFIDQLEMLEVKTRGATHSTSAKSPHVSNRDALNVVGAAIERLEDWLIQPSRVPRRPLGRNTSMSTRKRYGKIGAT